MSQPLDTMYQVLKLADLDTHTYVLYVIYCYQHFVQVAIGEVKPWDGGYTLPRAMLHSM